MEYNNNKPMVQQKKFSAMISTTGYQNMIANTLRDPDRQKRFVASITSAVANTPTLQTCEPGSILAGALLGEGLNLSPSPQLGQYYLVPFKCKAKDKNGNQLKDQYGNELYENKAQFVLGYKGYIQLAMRSGQYRKINVMVIKKGEIEDFDPFEEEFIGRRTLSYQERATAPTVGYAAYFEYLNGFRKTIYWTKEQMMAHADKFSPAFSAEALRRIEAGQVAERDMWKYSSFWYKDFDGMAKKTMLRQLISKWGIMSTEMQSAVISDDKITMSDPTNKDEPIITVDADAAPEETPTVMDAPAEPVQLNQSAQTVGAAAASRQVSLADL